MVREIYRLEAVSGKAVMEHPEAKRMLGHIASGRISALIFSKLARLARNTRELLDFADRFRENDADLISLQESIDTTSPAGRLFYTMIAAMAQWEREEIAERVAASVPIRAKMGKPLGGAAPFGYRWENRQLAPDLNEAPIRKLIYELFLEHRRKKKVARILNERGYRTRNGSKFSDTTIVRLMRDWTAKGVRRANYTKSRGEGKKWDFKPAENWVLIPVEPIVSEELWNQCNAILDERSDRHVARRGRPTVYLFTGLVHCQCGEKMYVPSKSRKYVCYKCRGKVGIADLEAVFQEQLKDFLVRPEDIAEHIGQADQEVQNREERIASLQEERGRTRSEREKLFRLYSGDHISPAGFAERNGPLEERLQAIEIELPRLQGELDFLKIQYLSKDEILTGGQDLYARWPALNFDEKRQIVEALVQHISVGKEEIELRLGYFPTPSEIAVGKPRIRARAAFAATRGAHAAARPTRSRAPGPRCRGRSWTGSTWCWRFRRYPWTTFSPGERPSLRPRCARGSSARGRSRPRGPLTPPGTPRFRPGTSRASPRCLRNRGRSSAARRMPFGSPLAECSARAASRARSLILRDRNRFAPTTWPKPCTTAPRPWGRDRSPEKRVDFGVSSR